MVYRLIERFMFMVAIVTTVGLVAASAHPKVLRYVPEFIAGMAVPSKPPVPPADPHEMDRFITMICYSGLGGFWSLFYSLLT